MKARTWFLSALALLLAVSVFGMSGCGRSGRVIASGQLTYKGQPVPSMRVTFYPLEEGSRASTGVTDDDGKFTLKYSRDEDGVLLGEHTVFLKYHVSAQEEMREIPPKASGELKAVITKYGDLKTSPLHYEIKGSGQFLDIHLE